MLSWIGLPPGTIPQWGAFLSLLGILMGAVTVYIRGIPERLRARNEADKIKIDAAEKIRTDYAAQIREFRAEVHGYRNDLQVITARLATSEATSRHRADKLRMMAFIVRLVLEELRSINPKNRVIGQAEDLLDELGKSEPKGQGAKPADGATAATA